MAGASSNLRRDFQSLCTNVVDCLTCSARAEFHVPFSVEVRLSPPPIPPDDLPGAGTADMVEVLYGELQTIAHRLRRGERGEHTLETSALIHEAFLRLAHQHAGAWQSRGYFLGAAANTMRRVLVDYARARNTIKRNPGERTTLVSVPGEIPGGGDVLDVIAVDDLLQRLETLDVRQARVVEMRVFGGFDIEEIAAALDVSPRTVKRDWRFAKAWLASQLTDNA